jgi:3-deoxy-D-manno-octulosonic-acid transferase
MAVPRPEGEVLWLHATSAERLFSLNELGARVKALRNDLVVLITFEPDLIGASRNLPDLSLSGVQIDSFVSDHPSETRQFLDHWTPDLCLWAGAVLMPNLISEAADRGISMILIDVDQNDFPTRRHKWFPDLARSSLERFEVIMTNSQAAFAMLHRIGVPAHKITTSEPLRNGPSPSPVAEEYISATSQQLAGRPLWLAAQVQADEFEAIIRAHRIALRMIHRLLLVLSVADPDTQDLLADNLKSSGLRFARWQVGDDIEDNTQVLISNGVDDQELWYRMAPLTFMASSLTVGNKGHNPLEAIALGSAILFGPHVLDHRDTYTRLSQGGAARSVGDAAGLGAAVIRTVAPDHAAAMALAGWQIVTEGAQLTDQLVELVQDKLDMRGSDHARA